MSGATTLKRNNGLVLLYQAAMVLEQQTVKDTAHMAFPVTSSIGLVSRPVTFQVSTGQRYGTKLDVPTVAVQTAQIPLTSLTRRQSPISRSSHNELEKTRRARLRQCLDSLRELLPLTQGEASRMTMLNVLKKSCVYLKELENVMGDQRTRLRQVDRRRVEMQMRRAHLMRLWRSLRKRAAAAANANSSTASTAVVSVPMPMALMQSTTVDTRSAGAAATAARQRRSPEESVAVSTVSVDPDAWRTRNASEISEASASSEEADLIHQQHRQYCLKAAPTQVTATAAANAKSAGAANSRHSDSCDSPDSGYVSPQNSATTSC